MIKRCIICFLIISFSNFTITPTFSYATRSYKGPKVDWDKIEDESDQEALTNALIIAGAVIVIGFVVYLLVKPKKSSYSTDKPETFNQTYADILSEAGEKILTPSGELVILKW